MVGSNSTSSDRHLPNTVKNKTREALIAMTGRSAFTDWVQLDLDSPIGLQLGLRCQGLAVEVTCLVVGCRLGGM